MSFLFFYESCLFLNVQQTPIQYCILAIGGKDVMAGSPDVYIGMKSASPSSRAQGTAYFLPDLILPVARALLQDLHF
jgi:hypothetical protein